MTENLYRIRRHTTRIIVHSSDRFLGVPAVTPILRTKGRAMGLLDVGYHFVIEQDGRVVQTRHWDSMGAHTPGCNHDSLGVYMVPSSAAQVTLFDLFLTYSNFGGAMLMALVTRQEALKRKRLPEGDDLRFLIPGAEYKVMDKYIEPNRSHSGPRLSAQQTALVDYLMSGRTCTNLIAITNLGIGSLSSRVAELRALGYPIKGEDGEDIHGKKYKKYSMDPETARASMAPDRGAVSIGHGDGYFKSTGADLLLTPIGQEAWRDKGPA